MNIFIFILKIVLLPSILLAALIISCVQSLVRVLKVISRKKYKKTGKTVVFTGGRSPATLELCRLFHRRGHRVVVLETQKFHLCRFTRAVNKNYKVTPPTKSYEEFIKNVGDVLVKEKADLLVGTCEEIFYLSKGKDILESKAPHCRMFFPNIAMLRSLHDKWEFAELVRQNREMEALDIGPPSTHLVTNEEEMKRAIESGEIVLKPCFSRFGQSTVILPKSMEDKKVRKTIRKLKQGTQYIAQKYIKGTQICTYSVVQDGNVLLHCCYGTEFSPSGRQGASLVWQPIYNPAVEQWVKSLMSVMRFTGHIAFDLMQAENGELFATECNPRATSGIHLYFNKPELCDTFFEDPLEFKTPLHPTEDQLPNFIASALLILNYFRKTGPNNLKDLGRWMEVYITGRSVIWDITDPLPVVTEIVGNGYVMLRGISKGQNSIEATSADIEWNGA